MYIYNIIYNIYIHTLTHTHIYKLCKGRSDTDGRTGDFSWHGLWSPLKSTRISPERIPTKKKKQDRPDARKQLLFLCKEFFAVAWTEGVSVSLFSLV